MPSILEVLAENRFVYSNEDELQTGIAQALECAGYTVQREVRLDGRSRLDLLVGHVGIEVKVAGKPDAVRRQLERYAESPLVSGLVLVTTRVRHHMPALMNGKCVDVVSLASAGL